MESYILSNIKETLPKYDTHDPLLVLHLQKCTSILCTTIKVQKGPILLEKILESKYPVTFTATRCVLIPTKLQ